MSKPIEALKPSSTFTSLSWAAAIAGIALYCLGLYNATLLLSEKGFYLIVLAMAVYSIVNVQKSVRDEAEGMETSRAHKGLNYMMLALSNIVFLIGLYNAELMLNEKGFFFIAFVLSLFASIVIQKNIRDTELFSSPNNKEKTELISE